MFESKKKPEEGTNKADQTPASKLEKAKKASTPSNIPPAMSKEMDEIIRRLRLLEERYSGLRKKTQLTEQNMLKDANELFDEVRLINDNITELKSDLSQVNEKLIKLVDEVKNSVKRSEYATLSKYLDFWEPLQFLTRKEAMRLIEESKNQVVHERKL